MNAYNRRLHPKRATVNFLTVNLCRNSRVAYRSHRRLEIGPGLYQLTFKVVIFDVYNLSSIQVSDRRNDIPLELLAPLVNGGQKPVSRSKVHNIL